jgi:hypothetical protein
MPYTRSLCVFLIAAAACCTTASQAAKFKINNRPPPGVMLSIGPSSAKIGKVAFKIKARDLGNGVALRGKPDMKITVANRAVPGNSRVAVLTVDSSIPLRNGSHTTPFTSISWVARDENIPSGRYDGSANQFLFSFANSQEIKDKHRFFYDNVGILEVGTYTGRVTYTLTMP